ncbi:hypothetical protein [Candidatus Nitrospira bockiana]
MGRTLDLPATTTRVPRQTEAELNERIRRQTACHIWHYGKLGPDAITRRLAELDQEWDIERTLEANAAVVSLIGLSLGTLLHRRWYLLPTLVATFLLQHAVQGWCPPVPLFRRMGVRTQTEIDYERYALKALRGDFRDVPQGPDAHERLEAEKMFEIVTR